MDAPLRAAFRTAIRTRLARTIHGEDGEGGEDNEDGEGDEGDQDSEGGRRQAGELLRPAAHSQILRSHYRSGGNAEPHRGSKVLVRPVPHGGEAGRRPRRRGPAGRVQIRLPDQRLRRYRTARFRRLRVRAAEI